jgi:uncharacterized protein YqjF (DUF2071 family)
MEPAEILRATAHRPWPLSAGPWVAYQSWQRLLFAHWPVPAAALRPLVPAPLEVEEAEGSGWVGVVPFLIAEARARGLPALPGLSRFPELNVRTYVRENGRPAVFFFSLDAASRGAVAGGRAVYRMPYHHADMAIAEEPQRTIRYRSCRRSDGAEFRGWYRPTGPAEPPAPGSLAHFLTERYELATVLRGGRVLRAQIHHAPWPLQTAEAGIETNTMARAAGIELPDTPPLLHFAERQDTLIWAPEIYGGRSA